VAASVSLVGMRWAGIGAPKPVPLPTLPACPTLQKRCVIQGVQCKEHLPLHCPPACLQYESSSSYNAMALSASHYGSLPYEALYEGYFLDVAAARQYIMLWLATQRAPYRQSNLTANMDQLMDLVGGEGGWGWVGWGQGCEVWGRGCEGWGQGCEGWGQGCEGRGSVGQEGRQDNLMHAACLHRLRLRTAWH
jgi:hypothetical protein